MVDAGGRNKHPDWPAILVLRAGESQNRQGSVPLHGGGRNAAGSLVVVLLSKGCRRKVRNDARKKQGSATRTGGPWARGCPATRDALMLPLRGGLA